MIESTYSLLNSKEFFDAVKKLDNCSSAFDVPGLLNWIKLVEEIESSIKMGRAIVEKKGPDADDLFNQPMSLNAEPVSLDCCIKASLTPREIRALGVLVNGIRPVEKPSA